MNNCDIPKVRLKFRQFLSYYAVNPDIWLLDPPFKYQSEAPNVFIVRLNPEFVQALNTWAYTRICTDETGCIQYRLDRNEDGLLQIHVKAHMQWVKETCFLDAMSLIDRYFNSLCGWEITFSWFGRMQYRLWRRRRIRSGEREKELQMYRDFLESIQSDVDEQFQKAKTYIDQARDDMKRLFNNK